MLVNTVLHNSYVVMYILNCKFLIQVIRSKLIGQQITRSSDCDPISTLVGEPKSFILF